LIHFDIDERYQDEAVVGTAISRREGVLLSVTVHVLVALALVFAPQLDLFQPSLEERQQAEARRLALEQKARDNRTFVFVQPKVDMKAPTPPQRAELSDSDRRAQAPQVAPNPENPLPFSRGTTTERVEASPPTQQAQIQPPTPEPATQEPPAPQAPSNRPRLSAQAETGYVRPGLTARTAPGKGALGEALQNLQRYVQKGSFDNPRGGASQPGAAIQFDTKGVEFGPWIRRFVAQVKRNWFVPNAAWLLKGRVVLQFNIHKDGRISDIAVVGPSSVDAFNNAAYNAILTSNPTEPLPAEYPDEQTLFTVTFYYNEDPSSY